MKYKLLKMATATAVAGSICLWQTPGRAEVSGADKEFLKKASESNVAEIQAGEMAQKKGTSSQVKMMGEHIATSAARVGGIDANVVPRFIRIQFAAICNGPSFEVCQKPVRVIQDEGGGFWVRECPLAIGLPTILPLTFRRGAGTVTCKFSSADQCSDDGRERRRRVSRILLPTFLPGDRPMTN